MMFPNLFFLGIESSMDLPRAPLVSHQVNTKDAKYWSSIIKFHAKHKNDRGILKSFTEMESSGVMPHPSTLPLVIKACARLQAVEEGKKIHSSIQNTRLIRDLRIRTSLVDFYCKCGFVGDASDLFEKMGEKDIVSWKAMICGYVENSMYEDAIALSFQMKKEKLKLNSTTMVGLLWACSELTEYELGQEIHCYCLRNGYFDSNPHVGTSLIGFYARFNTKISRFVFDLMVVKSVVSWNAMISCYYNAAEFSEAVNLLVQMLVSGITPCSVTMLLSIQSCASLECPRLGQQVHQLTFKYGYCSDIYVENALVNMYGKTGKIESSDNVFENMQIRDVASWNAMIFGYKFGGYYDKALNLLTRMQDKKIKADVVTFATALQVCGECSSVEKAKAIHACIIKHGLELNDSIQNALLSSYANLNCLELARRVFSQTVKLDVVSWNTFISALVQNQLAAEAWQLYHLMRGYSIRPNSFTMVSLLAGCIGESFLNIGRSIHGLDMNSSLCTALTEMYINCGDETTGRFLFENFPDRDLVSWNSIIASYIQNGQPSKALSLFHEMQSKMRPNFATLVNILSACASLANLLLGRTLHGYTMRRELALEQDITLENALIVMYSKCGSLQNGYGMHGRVKDALNTFSQMQSAVLSACSHSGMVEMGWKIFHSMSQDYGLDPEVVHYASMVDLLARAGQLGEAKNFIDSMPVEPDPCAWRALLGACRVYSNIELAETASQKLLELEPMSIGNYVLISNMYAAVGKWDEVERLRLEIKEKGLQKAPGLSWLVVKDELHPFMAGDVSHPEAEKIYRKLIFLTSEMIESGYVPDLSWPLFDLEDWK
ncbi:hypothetical protein H6P81_009394 [Aristolochia fimbriata]|uniref:Chlororespiratory reduction 21 n=1 Tax=Aristolochia fimbriata TaxID=158543 RepID=A0AAV7EL17_ARIFI|nr:hypothetical protein H6P81_009394 [Aristolochia fimbriata]